MPKFHILSGNLVLAAQPGHPSGKKQISIGFGAEVEMSDTDRKAVDPHGDKLATPEAFAELRKAADAHSAFLARQKALGSAPVALTPKLLAAFEALALSEKKPEPKKLESKKEGAK